MGAGYEDWLDGHRDVLCIDAGHGVLDIGMGLAMGCLYKLDMATSHGDGTEHRNGHGVVHGVRHGDDRWDGRGVGMGVSMRMS